MVVPEIAPELVTDDPILVPVLEILPAVEPLFPLVNEVPVIVPVPVMVVPEKAPVLEILPVFPVFCMD